MSEGLQTEDFYPVVENKAVKYAQNVIARGQVEKKGRQKPFLNVHAEAACKEYLKS